MTNAETKKVYILWSGDYESRTLDGVFVSREAIERHIAALVLEGKAPRSWFEGDGAEIEEATVQS